MLFLSSALWQGVFAVSMLSIFIVQQQVARRIPSAVAYLGVSAIQCVLYFGALSVVFYLQPSPIPGGFAACCVIITSLKMHSFFATCQLLMEQPAERAAMSSHVNIKHFCYFLAAPTLVYEPEYPRNKVVRWWWVGKQLLGCSLCLFISHLLLVQFMLPVLREVEEESSIWYDIVRLAVPSIVSWLLGFYAFFHCFLNATAEVLAFADRQFYLDWWNAASLDVFWRKWNLLVHEWLLRHVYLQSIRRHGTSKHVATMVVFFVSAVFHELIFWVAFRVLRPWFFLAMFAQIPLIFISRVLFKSMDENHRQRWGNIFVWLGFFIGHPLIEILYIRQWFQINNTTNLFCAPDNPDMVVLGWF